jgi:hypothetical protein
MEHDPSLEADSFSARHEIPRLLWDPNVHYLDQKTVTGPCRKPHRSSPHHILLT